MSNKMNTCILWIITTCIALILTTCDVIPSSSDEEIRSWSERYCQIATDFTQGFMINEAQPSGDWEASYEFIKHYRRTIDASEIALQSLNQMDIPDEARPVHNTTIDVLVNVKTIANEAIQDVENAVDRVLFQTAIDRYATRLQEQAHKLEMATQEASPRVREKLLGCLP